jgi:hypothetical protein
MRDLCIVFAGCELWAGWNLLTIMQRNSVEFDLINAGAILGMVVVVAVLALIAWGFIAPMRNAAMQQATVEVHQLQV